MDKGFKCREGVATVDTKEGKVRGYEHKGIQIFKGIPYAHAKRFHAPERVAHWDGELDCTSYGYVCPLLSMPKPNNELLVPHRYWVMDEDCMNLNLWTPACDDKKRPVIVWLHGGGFEAGSAIEHWAYEGENMCREADCVVISINHRLNILGYLDLSDYGEEYEDSGNNGTNDMIKALEWIRDNVALFGGDPGNVTLFGQSGGGMKITTLMQTPAADGLFHRGLIMSGVINDDVLQDSTGSGKDCVEAIMAELGLKSIKELEKARYVDMAEAYEKVKGRLAKEGKNIGGGPHPNKYYVGDPLRVGFRKENADMPLMIGTCFAEFSTFKAAPYDKHTMSDEEQVAYIEKALGEESADSLIPLFRAAYPERNVIDLMESDVFFRPASRKYIHERAKLNAHTYAYMFNFESLLDGGRAPWHCADVPFFFNNIEYVPTAQKEGVSEKLQAQMFNAFMSFAKDGDPNNNLIPEWKPSTEETEYTIIFDEDTRVKENYDHKLVDVIETELYPKYKNQFLENAGVIQH